MLLLSFEVEEIYDDPVNAAVAALANIAVVDGDLNTFRNMISYFFVNYYILFFGILLQPTNVVLLQWSMKDDKYEIIIRETTTK